MFHITQEYLRKKLSFFHPDLLAEIEQAASVKEIPKDTEILREGQFIKIIPIVLEGLVRVFTRHEDKELLLYYIKPAESCIMSFSASLQNETSRVFALTEEDSLILLLPVDKLRRWSAGFPDINSLFFQLFNLRYSELLDTIHHILFDKMDKRLYDYLLEKVKLTRKNPLKISHRQIAQELGTAREVISRVIKKLENEGKLKQFSNSIEIYPA
ncbi:MAG: Crp/Fnr family transcriptional regulator [Microscillaceae bacterium]|nr:Crp/Fnr family transcriptional regulator [Microscillaceae bacterium]